MKLYIAIGVVLALLEITEAAVDYNEVISQCAAETGVTTENLTNYVENIANDRTVDSNDKADCYFACLMLETGSLSDGSIVYSEWVKLYSEAVDRVKEELKDITANCGYIYNDAADVCTATTEFYRCAASTNRYLISISSYDLTTVPS